MIAVFNWRPYDGKGALIGFFSLQYYDLTVKGCRLMAGKNGHWVSLPQKEITHDDGHRQWIDLLFFSTDEKQQVRRQVIDQLEADGHLLAREPGPGPAAGPEPSAEPGPSAAATWPRNYDGSDDLSEFYSQNQPGDDIKF